MTAEYPHGVLFVMPSFRGRSTGIDSRWLAASDFAAALGRLFGRVDILTPYGLCEPDEVETWAVPAGVEMSIARRALHRLPRPVRVFLGDVREWRRARSMRRLAEGLERQRYGLVVQFHRRFHDCGAILAQRIGAPFVLRVEALEVQEEASWGVRRRGWGRVVERMGERRVFRQAPLIAAVSEVVDSQLADAGVPATHRIVIPNGVDLDAFSPGDPVVDLRNAYGLDGRFVVGWIGGFRPFHGLELVPEIARGLRDRVPDAILCLLGTGPLRHEVAAQLYGLRETVRILDPVPHVEVPQWIRTFDACLLLAPAGPFHYSPLKLFEYLGCGRPVVAAAVGQVATTLEDDRDSLLVSPGDPEAVVRAIKRLALEPGLRTRLGAAGRRTAERLGSWDMRAATLVEALEARRLLSRAEGISSQR